MYQYFNYFLESNIIFPELPESQSGSSKLKFSVEDTPSDSIPLKWYNHWHYQDGTIYLSCAKITDGFFLRFIDIADFKINVVKNTIQCYPCNDIDVDLIRHLFLDQVIPRYVSLFGNLILHASAVIIDNKLVLFLGDTGAGKSTLAATLLDDDTKILTDDCVMLFQSDGRMVGIPNYTGLRLWPDSYEVNRYKLGGFTVLNSSEKKKMVPKKPVLNPENTNIPVEAIFELNTNKSSSDSSKIEIKKITGANQIITLLKHAFTLEINDKDAIKNNFLNNSCIAASNITIHHLHYTHEYTHLNDVKIAIQNIINP